MLLKHTLKLNLAWSSLMVFALFLLAAGAPSMARTVSLLASLVFLGVSIAAMFQHRWAIVVVVLTSMLALACWLPPTLINTWMFLTGHPWYIDSPGTILVVAGSASVFAIPALFLVATYAYQWRSLYSLLLSGHNNSPKPKSLRDSA